MLSTPRPYRFINTPMIMYMRTNGKKLKRDRSRNFRNLHTKSTTDKQHTNKQTNKKEVLGTLGMKITHHCKDHSSFITKRFYYEPTKWPALSLLARWAGKELHRCRKGHGLKSRTGLNFFRLHIHHISFFIHYCFSRVLYCEDHSHLHDWDSPFQR